MGYQCSFNPDHGPAVLVVTYLETGDTVSPCGGCIPPMVATMAGAMGYTVTDTADPDAGPTEPAPAGRATSRKRPGKAAQRAADGPTGPAPATGTDMEGEAGGDLADDGGSPDPDRAGGDGAAAAGQATLTPAAAHQTLQGVTGGIA